MKQKIFITGITGFVGRHLVNHLIAESLYKIGGIGLRPREDAHLPTEVAYWQVDIRNRSQVLDAIESFDPDWIIHTAAMSKPNECETNRLEAYETNVLGTKNLADACQKRGSQLIHLSTDFVFGHQGPFAESDDFDPLNYYGETKCQAESLLANYSFKKAIVRTVLVYGKEIEGAHASFPQWVAQQLSIGNSIKVFTDQYRTATYVDDLVGGLIRIIQQQAVGCFHICGEEVVTPFSFAEKIANHLQLSAANLVPVTKAEFREPAERPIRSTLRINRAQEILAYQPTSIDRAIQQIFQERIQTPNAVDKKN